MFLVGIDGLVVGNCLFLFEVVECFCGGVGWGLGWVWWCGIGWCLVFVW